MTSNREARVASGTALASESLVHASPLAIATMTLARDAQQSAALLAALHTLSRTEAPIYVADGGSTPAFTAALTALPVTIVPPQRPGLVGQVEAGLAAAAASGATRVLYTEPDKEWFFANHLDAFLAGAPDDRDVGVVVAARSESAFATFPRFQQRTERMFNELCAEIVGDANDYLYGPFIVAAPLVAEIAGLDPIVGWGWRPFLFNRARRRGFRIAFVAGEFDCPIEQRGADEQVHRLRQLSQNVEGLARSCL
jgi:hypothetical protein